MRNLLATAPLLVALAGVGNAAVCDFDPIQNSCVINNGLAPPNPANVIDDGTHASDWVYVRNVGCPPGWPDYDPDAPCPSPGAPTEVALVEGGEVLALYAFESSTITMIGGELTYRVDLRDSSKLTMSGGISEAIETFDTSTAAITGGEVGLYFPAGSSTLTKSGGTASALLAEASSTFTMSGGTLTHWLHAHSSSTTTISGGTVSTELRAYDSSTITIVGRNFEVDEAPVPYGDLAALTGTLTGTLASGGSVNSVFHQGGGSYTGTITLSPPPVIPALPKWGYVALAGGLIVVGAAVMWRRAP
jgi:hypothetical protein